MPSLSHSPPNQTKLQISKLLFTRTPSFYFFTILTQTPSTTIMKQKSVLGILGPSLGWVARLIGKNHYLFYTCGCKIKVCRTGMFILIYFSFMSSKLCMIIWRLNWEPLRADSFSLSNLNIKGPIISKTVRI